MNLSNCILIGYKNDKIDFKIKEIISNLVCMFVCMSICLSVYDSEIQTNFLKYKVV